MPLLPWTPTRLSDNQIGMRRITATQAARNFSQILDQVRFRGESYIVERNGEPICRIEPSGYASRVTVTELRALLASTPPPDDTFARDVAAIQKSQPRLPRSPWAS